MKRYRRFPRGDSEKPVLFFAGAFVLGTILLVGTFLLFNTRESTSQEVIPAVVVQEQEKQKEEAVLPSRTAPSEEEYQSKLRAALSTFLDEARVAMGGWLDAPDWEARMQQTGVAKALIKSAEKLRAELLSIVVPAQDRARHLSITATVDDLLALLGKGSAERVDGPLLKLKEFVR